MRKKVILAMTQDVKLYECFVKNLEFLGYEVVLLKAFNERCITRKDRKINSLIKKLSRKLKNKRLLRLESRYNLELLQRIENEQVDISLVIRADLFEDAFLVKLKEISVKMIAYQWDGLSRFPKIYDKIKFFDKFFVFDAKDLKAAPNLHLTNNFYFDYLIDKSVVEPEYDVYYIGSYDHRIEDIIKITSQLYQKGLKLNVRIAAGRRNREALACFPHIKTKGIVLSYEENLKQVKNAKIILDFAHHTLHEGLSFRPFEAMGFQKKLITTNPLVTQADFYDAKQICLYNGEKELEDFIKQTDSLYTRPAKYSFTNWFEEIIK